jgi:TetR/AcrR family transcriptional regulator, regulator of cefoperazone and chloramphenicol sensitivity
MSEPDLTRERLLAAAGQVFAAEGFQGATIRKIKERAEANIAAVNYYFGDKERLYIEAVKFAFASCVKDMRFPDWPPGTPADQKLRDFIAVFVNRLLDPSRPQWHPQLMMRELASPSGACFEIVRDYIRPVAMRLSGVLEDILPAEMPSWKRFMVAFSIVGQCLYYVQNKPIAIQLVGEEDFRNFDAKTVAEHITHFTLAALGLREPLGHSRAPT